MSRCAQFSRSGFTLLEMCIVLFIIALLSGMMLPSMQSVLSEQSMRNDSRQLSFMVRSAMLQSEEQHRPYVLELTSTSLSLHPVNASLKDDDTADSGDTDSADSPSDAPVDLKMFQKLDSQNKLLVPDPKKAGAWVAMPDTSWTFKPGELCPATTVRLARGPPGWKSALTR